ncbi:hypothetical protein AB870_25155 (plasmid) [Pandoraea faecigallinarum]|uniref:Replication protein O n=1 Tax=Pandoraea faecigallinarum TaxID=656179 RepID=A0A173H066_9BURK|nr:hypothetical protein [Pandoraea faecigallinarum]ANI21836.1 hypothetical protein AB870_25155 [Pandoraea faecigallinarum]
MCIAQHFVASEESLHASEKGIHFESDNTNLPWVILRAVHRASRLDGIPARARAVLAALARTVDAKKPYGEIFARRELLSERAMQSERTFYRSLADLEAAGLIERPPQRRYVSHGLFGRAYLHLSARAAILLGLIEVTVEDDDLDGTEAVEETQAHSLGEPQAVQRFDARGANVADGAITKDLSPISLQKRQPGRLPSDLERLRTLGFHEFLIFKMMREAREHGKRLSDVVEATWTHLAKASRPINYLRKLLASPVDFGYQLRAKAAEQARMDFLAAQQRCAETFVHTNVGKIFVDAQGLHQCVLDDGGRSLAITHLAEGVVRRSAGNWQVTFMTSVKSGQLRAVTPHELAQIREAAIARRGLAPERAPVSMVPNAYRVCEEALPSRLASPPSRVPTAEAHAVSPVIKQKDAPRTLTTTAAEALAALRAMCKPHVTSTRGRASTTPEPHHA